MRTPGVLECADMSALSKRRHVAAVHDDAGAFPRFDETQKADFQSALHRAQQMTAHDKNGGFLPKAVTGTVHWLA
jgi:hypothetical protein